MTKAEQRQHDALEERVTALETQRKYDLLHSYGWTPHHVGVFSGTRFWTPPKELRKAGLVDARSTDDAIRLEGWRGHFEVKGA